VDARGRAEERAGETLLLANANTVGLFGLRTLVWVTACVLATRRVSFKLLSVMPVPFGLYLIAASGSRKAMIGFMLSAAALYYYHFRKAGASSVGKRLLAILIGLMIVAGSVYFVVKMPHFFRLTRTLESTASVQEQARFQYFIRGMQKTAESPIFGMGAGGFALAGLGTGAHGAHYSHSTVTETLSCTGVPGFLLYFGGQLLLYLLLQKLRKAKLPPRDAAMVNILMVLFWLNLMTSVLAVALGDRLIWPLLGAICGYLAYLKQTYVDGSPSGRPIVAAGRV
jgi:hypothetical protein